MIACLQMCSGPNYQANLANLEKRLIKLPEIRPLMVCLPESFVCFASEGTQILKIAKSDTVRLIIDKLSELCRKYNIWLAAGTIPIMAADNKYYAASLVFNDLGEQVADYNKIHLFDVEISDNTGCYKESKYTQKGNKLTVVDTPFGRIGLTVCYDVRFAAIYNQLAELGAEIILVPSAFTKVTGEAHWQVLLQARAIENQCYIIAAAQSGKHENGRETYGHSLIINPWGKVLAELDSGEGMIYSTIDLRYLNEVRQKMPVLSHTRFKNELKNDDY